ncbi:MAG: tRNA (5-methylaminomethyl-2-thiouridine)(34)-methyltransferase MnmD [Rhodobacteraceae bacterium]|nr:tRNA (5-methylaminomethyl-2-thiouridine)(34)-methyltransferase MnmD [Paracoccaceae bacterium]
MQGLTDIPLPDANKIRDLLDIPSTQTTAARCRSLPADVATRIVRRIEHHHTRRHAVWLDRVEVENGVLQGQCLNRCIPDRQTLEAEIMARRKQRNGDNKQTSWMFTVDKARDEMMKACPNPNHPNRSPKRQNHRGSARRTCKAPDKSVNQLRTNQRGNELEAHLNCEMNGSDCFSLGEGTTPDSDMVEWSAESVPRSKAFGDTYYDGHDGLAESRAVFLEGNDLSNRLQDGFRIGELGFGTGLNLLACLDLWQTRGCDGRFQFTTFEAYPLNWRDMQRALEAFPVLSELAEALVRRVRAGETKFQLASACVRIVRGDARKTLPVSRLCVDAWFLDGFSPRCNPQMWERGLMHNVARCTHPGGTMATFTAAGWVRRNLASAGFDVVRTAGHGSKRHMLIGQLRKAPDR